MRTPDPSREAFEKWADDVFYDGAYTISEDWSIERNLYMTASHHMAFHAWQAAMAHKEAERWQPIESGLPASVEFDIRFEDGSMLCGCLLQSDGDVWWSGAECGERFFDPVFAPITHYRIPTPPAQEDGNGL